jgi:hypothetical protein
VITNVADFYCKHEEALLAGFMQVILDQIKEQR